MLALLLAWLPPSIGALDTRFLGAEYVDHYGTQWFYWYAGQVLRGLQDPLHTDLFFYPWGKDVYGHTGSNILDALLAQPLLAVLGQVPGYNAFVLVIMVTNAWGAARLARAWTDDGLIRWVVGGLFAFQPYLLNELMEGRPTQALMLFVLLFVERLLKLGREPGWRGPVMAGIWLALTGYTYWFYALFAGVGAAAAGLWMAAHKREHAVRILARCALAGAVAIALVLPVAISLLKASAAGQVPGLLDVASWTSDLMVPMTREGQLVGLYTWQPFGGGQGFWIVTLAGEEHFIPRLDPLPLALLVPLLALVLRPGRLPRAELLLFCLAAALIGVGPLFVSGSVAVNNPLYALLLRLFAPLQRLWWPGRAFAVIAIVAPLGAIPLLGAVRSGRNRVFAAAGLVGALAFALVRAGLLPASSWSATIPAGYQCLAQGPEGAIIELPYAFTQGHLYYQTAHGRPIFGGMLEDNEVFAPTELVALKNQNTFLQSILGGPPTAGPQDIPITDADKAAIHDLGYKYVVLQVDAFRARAALEGMAEVMMDVRLRATRRSFDKVLGTPVYEDARVVIWAPWGDPAPCDARSFSRDKDSPGRTDVLSKSRDRGEGRALSHLGRADDAAVRIAQMVIDRDGPDKDAAARVIQTETSGAKGTQPPSPPKGGSPEGGTPPR